MAPAPTCHPPATPARVSNRCPRSVPRRLPLSGLLIALSLAMSQPCPAAQPSPTPQRPRVWHNLPAAPTPASATFASTLRVLTNAFDPAPVPADPTPGWLSPPAVLLLCLPGNPGTPQPVPPHLTPASILDFIRRGGGLVLMTHQTPDSPAPRLAHDLLNHLGLSQSPRRTGAKSILTPASHPFATNLTWSPDGLSLFDTQESTSLHPMAAIPNDPSRFPTAPGLPDFAGFILVSGSLNRGRVVLLADADWILDRPALGSPPRIAMSGDHPALLLQTLSWAAQSPLLP